MLVHGNREIGQCSLIFNEFFVVLGIGSIETVFQSVGIICPIQKCYSKVLIGVVLIEGWSFASFDTKFLNLD